VLLKRKNLGFNALLVTQYLVQRNTVKNTKSYIIQLTFSQSLVKLDKAKNSLVKDALLLLLSRSFLIFTLNMPTKQKRLLTKKKWKKSLFKHLRHLLSLIKYSQSYKLKMHRLNKKKRKLMRKTIRNSYKN